VGGYDLDDSQTNIFTSTDGITWTGRRSATPESLLGVTYANGQFIAVGEAETIVTSPDGFTWTNHSPGIRGGFYGVAGGPGQFVAVGGDIMTSPDGVTWTSRISSVTSDTLTGVAFGKGRFVNVGGLFAGGGGLIIPMPDGSDGGVILNSLDGVAWTKTLETPHRFYEVIFANDTFVSVGSAGTILTSGNGVDWVASDSTTTNNLHGVAIGNGQFIAVGEKGTVVTSPDGVLWTQHSAGLTTQLEAVTYGNGQFVAVGYDFRHWGWEWGG